MILHVKRANQKAILSIQTNIAIKEVLVLSVLKIRLQKAKEDVIGKAVGISIAVGLLVAAVIVAVIYFCRKRVKEANPEASTELQDEKNKFLPGDKSQKNEAEEAEGSGP
ncbi:hypothetical protein C0Q70_12358 [Pomacea canaliculata]|uniref:Uncharacterized protein n=1 Tax=Pomacea canaliculata TaxID=400727 RepID=A0A2T7P1C3_POMCA|nr:hypothetical protein C0Q70_12358 [Pomacea canaliculata]